MWRKIRFHSLCLFVQDNTNTLKDTWHILGRYIHVLVGFKQKVVNDCLFSFHQKGAKLEFCRIKIVVIIVSPIMLMVWYRFVPGCFRIFFLIWKVLVCLSRKQIAPTRRWWIWLFRYSSTQMINTAHYYFKIWTWGN